VDFSFLRAKAVPLGAAVVAIAAVAAGSAYADLYRLRKAEKLLTTRLAEESAEPFGSAKTAEQVLDANGPAGTAAASPMPRLSAYDLLLDISAHIPGTDKITLDIEKMTIDDQKIDINGTTKSAEEIDLLISEIKKIECFKNNLTRGPTDTLPSGAKRFKLTITAQCLMGAS
ncbi:MAG TPA: hypothetical protein VF516_39245, partial [Kofleriaceae bacterium]